MRKLDQDKPEGIFWYKIMNAATKLNNLYKTRRKYITFVSGCFCNVLQLRGYIYVCSALAKINAELEKEY